MSAQCSAQRATALVAIGGNTCDCRIQKRLHEMTEKGDTSIESLRGFYDLRVDVFEETYAEFAMSDEYQQACEEKQLYHLMVCLTEDDIEAG